MKKQSFSVPRLIGSFAITAAAVAYAVLLMTGADGAQSASSPPATVQSGETPKFLEFDIPGDTSAVTAFIVGYFAPGEKVPAFSFEVPRSRVESPKPGSMRVPLIVGPLPAGQTYTIRLRTVAGGSQSSWSGPSGSFTVPANPVSPVGNPIPAPADTPGAERALRPERTRKTAAAELEQDPELKKRLVKEFPGIDLVSAATGFRTVPDLATALFAAGNLKIPFAEIKKLTAEAGNRDVRKAIAKLKPGVDARAEARRARAQARAVIQKSRK